MISGSICRYSQPKIIMTVLSFWRREREEGRERGGGEGEGRERGGEEREGEERGECVWDILGRLLVSK